MATTWGKFSTAKNSEFTPKKQRLPKAPAPKASSKVKDVNPGLPTVGRLGGFKPIGGSRSKTYYGG
jgi:hypothetical protein